MSALQPSNSFSAHLALAAGVAVSITAETLEQLALTVGKLQGGVPVPAGTKTATPTVAKDTKPAAQETPAANAAASTSTPASGSEPAADAPRFTYDDVKARVLSLSKVKRELAVETLGKFKTVAGDKVDHGNKLQLADYPAFIAAADKALKA